MSFFAKVVKQQLTSGSTANVVITGVGFLPKVAILMSAGRSSDPSLASPLRYSRGAATSSTQQYAVGYENLDNRTGANGSSSTIRNDCCLVKWDAGGGATAGQLALSSFDADGATFTVPEAFNSSIWIYILFLGGTDIAEAEAGVKQLGASTGNQSFTGAALSGTPDCMLFGWAAQSTTLNGNAGRGTPGIGIGISSSSRACVAMSDDHGEANGTGNAISMTNRCMVFLPAAAGSPQTEVDFVSRDAGGWTVNRLSGFLAAEYGYLAIRGIQVDLRTITSQTSSGTFDTTGLAFQPIALMLAANPTATATQSSSTAPGELTFGLATAATERAAVWLYADAPGALSGGNPTDTFSRGDSAQAFADYDRDSLNTTSANGEIDFDSFLSTGYRLNQTDAAEQASLIHVLAFGAAAAGGGSAAAFPRQRARLVDREARRRAILARRRGREIGSVAWLSPLSGAPPTSGGAVALQVRTE